jgi:23S rRNA (cytidine1920-2'-O)/16S rRNA (cytidine1409-2'-O)-methyltransferase
VVLEGCDARRLSRELVPEPVGAVVADVSFISLMKALPVPLALTGSGAWLVALIKPQFEAGRAAVGKGGIVRDPMARRRAVDLVRNWVAGQPGWHVRAVIPSPIGGGSGNEEFLLGAVRDDKDPRSGN